MCLNFTPLRAAWQSHSSPLSLGSKHSSRSCSRVMAICILCTSVSMNGFPILFWQVPSWSLSFEWLAAVQIHCLPTRCIYNHLYSRKTMLCSLYNGIMHWILSAQQMLHIVDLADLWVLHKTVIAGLQPVGNWWKRPTSRCWVRRQAQTYGPAAARSNLANHSQKFRCSKW